MAKEELTGHGYYTVIPMRILLDESINPKARLLFGIISNLANQKGYCFASNSYLANVTGWHHKTISGFVNELHKAGYIDSQLGDYGQDRRIYITEGVERNDGTPHREMTAHNNIIIKVKDNYIPAGANKERNDGTPPSKTSAQQNEKIKPIGTGQHFILITPPQPDTPTDRLHRHAGVRQAF